MKKNKLNNKGFSHIEIFVVVIVLAAIMGIGYHVLAKKNTAHAGSVSSYSAYNQYAEACYDSSTYSVVANPVSSVASSIEQYGTNVFIKNPTANADQVNGSGYTSLYAAPSDSVYVGLGSVTNNKFTAYPDTSNSTLNSVSNLTPCNNVDGFNLSSIGGPVKSWSDPLWSVTNINASGTVSLSSLSSAPACASLAGYVCLNNSNLNLPVLTAIVGATNFSLNSFTGNPSFVTVTGKNGVSTDSIPGGYSYSSINLAINPTAAIKNANAGSSYNFTYQTNLYFGDASNGPVIHYKLTFTK